MAVVERLSGHITNRDATPRVYTNAGVAAGMVKGFVGTLETVSGDSIGSTYRFGTVPSNAVMQALIVDSDDFGLYQQTHVDAGAVVDADFFASALSLNGGALSHNSILHESGVFGLEDAEKPLWEALGLSSDPNRLYDVVATLTAAADAAATITVRCLYSV